jgi:hypothetical protein
LTSYYVNTFQELAVQIEQIKKNQKLLRLDASQVYLSSRDEHRLDKQLNLLERALSYPDTGVN